MASKLSRRAWTSALLAMPGAAAAATAAAAAQAPPPSTSDTPADLLEQARQNIVRNREAMARVKLPMSAEPATRFEA